MNKIVIAAAAALVAFGSTGIAAAKDAPQLIGNFSANVLEANNGSQIRNEGVGIDYTSTASIESQGVDRAYSVGNSYDQPTANAPVFTWSDSSYSR